MDIQGRGPGDEPLCDEIKKMNWILGRGKQTVSGDIATQLTLADKISRLTIRSSNARQIARETVKELSDLMPIDRASMALINKAEGKALFRVLIGHGESEEDSSLEIAGTPVAWVAKNKQALVEPDPVEKRHFSTNILGKDIVTQIHMPLFYQGEVFGVLTVGSHKAKAYTEAHMRILRYTVIHLAISLQSFLLLDRNLKTEASLNDLSDLLSIITSRAEITEVFPQFAARLRKVVPFDHLSLNHVEGNIIRILAAFGEKESSFKMNDVYPLADSAIPWLQEYGDISVEENLSRQNLFSVDKLYLENGFKGAIRIPLFSHGRLFASFVLLSCEPFHLNGDTDFLKRLSQYLATPVESYILYRYEKQRFEWLTALSHHLKTPLTPIISSSQLLVEQFQHKDGDPLAKLSRNILTGAEKLNNNLKIFWDLSEVESPGFLLKLKDIDIRSILNQAAAEVLPAAKAGSRLLKLGIPDSLPHIHADPQRILQVLRTLLDNSVKNSPRKGKIELRAKMAGGELIVEVADSGKALSPEERAKLVQPYRLSEADQRSFPELALNIAISRRIIESHGGTLWISSEAGKGNILGFSLPVKP